MRSAPVGCALVDEVVRGRMWCVLVGCADAGVLAPQDVLVLTGCAKVAPGCAGRAPFPPPFSPLASRAERRAAQDVLVPAVGAEFGAPSCRRHVPCLPVVLRPDRGIGLGSGAAISARHRLSAGADAFHVAPL